MEDEWRSFPIIKDGATMALYPRTPQGPAQYHYQAQRQTVSIL